MDGLTRLRQTAVVAVQRVLRVATRRDSDDLDGEDLAQTTPEERIAAVERLRQEWFGDFAPERRLARALACSDLEGHPIPRRWWTRDRGPRRADRKSTRLNSSH